MKTKLLFIVIAWIVITIIALSDAKAGTKKYRIYGFDMAFEDPPLWLVDKMKELQALLVELKPYAVKPSDEENPIQAKMHICNNDIQQPCVAESIENVDIDKTIENKKIEVKVVEVESEATPTPTPKPK